MYVLTAKDGLKLGKVTGQLFQNTAANPYQSAVESLTD